MDMSPHVIHETASDGQERHLESPVSALRLECAVAVELEAVDDTLADRAVVLDDEDTLLIHRRLPTVPDEGHGLIFVHTPRPVNPV